jgi:hypothetical protein
MHMTQPVGKELIHQQASEDMNGCMINYAETTRRRLNETTTALLVGRLWSDLLLDCVMIELIAHLHLQETTTCSDENAVHLRI